MQEELAGLSSNGKQVIAEESGQYIQLDQPQLVIEAIEAASRNLCTHQMPIVFNK